MPVDYKGGGRSNLTSSEFSSHHRCGFHYKRGYLTKGVPSFFVRPARRSWPRICPPHSGSRPKKGGMESGLRLWGTCHHFPLIGRKGGRKLGHVRLCPVHRRAMRNASAYSAASTRVLSAKYAGALRTTPRSPGHGRTPPSVPLPTTRFLRSPRSHGSRSRRPVPAGTKYPSVPADL